MGVIMVLGVIVCVAAFAWTGVRLRDLAPGPERDAWMNSFWFLGGSAVLLIALVLGMEPLRQPISVRIAVLALSGSLTAVGSLNARRLAAARGQQFLMEGQQAETLVDRVNALEGLRANERGLPIRFRVVLLGGKLGIAASAVWAASIIPKPLVAGIFAVVALGHLVWAGVDALGIVQARRTKRECDAKIEVLILSREGEGSGERLGNGGTLPIT